MSASLPRSASLASGMRPARADAARNRERLLDAARAAFTAAEEVDTVSLHGIARAAGVGQGTLYRHFPTREDLLLAVYEADVRALVESAPALLAAESPREAMRRWLAALGAYGQVKRGLAQVVAAATGRALSDRWRAPVLEAIELLLAAGREAGEIRDDIAATDVLQLCSFLWLGPANPDGLAGAERLIDIVLDGLGAGGAGGAGRAGATQ